MLSTPGNAHWTTTFGFNHTQLFIFSALSASPHRLRDDSGTFTKGQSWQ